MSAAIIIKELSNTNCDCRKFRCRQSSTFFRSSLHVARCADHEGSRWIADMIKCSSKCGLCRERFRAFENVLMPFGKYKGTAVTWLYMNAYSYLVWLINENIIKSGELVPFLNLVKVNSFVHVD